MPPLRTAGSRSTWTATPGTPRRQDHRHRLAPDLPQPGRRRALAPRESAPAALENWARRRGTLAPDANEQHLGLDDTDLMLRTVQAEFNLKNLFAK